jgi:hypothetical protein
VVLEWAAACDFADFADDIDFNHSNELWNASAFADATECTDASDFADASDFTDAADFTDASDFTDATEAEENSDIIELLSFASVIGLGSSPVWWLPSTPPAARAWVNLIALNANTSHLPAPPASAPPATAVDPQYNAPLIMTYSPYQMALVPTPKAPARLLPATAPAATSPAISPTIATTAATIGPALQEQARNRSMKQR